MDKPSRDEELGALWIKDNGRGQYMTGEVAGQRVILFRNDRKRPGSTEPDWRVLKAKPRATSAAPADDIPF